MISITIPTINHLSALKLTIQSFQKNTTVPFEICVWDNGSNDGTKEWCESQDITFYRSENNAGLSIPWNTMIKNAKYEKVLLFGNDHYVLPGWDSIIAEMDETGARWRSPMQIERDRPTRSITGNYGTDPSNFNEEALLRDFEGRVHPTRHYQYYIPHVMYKEDYLALGGMDESKFLSYHEFLRRVQDFCETNGILPLSCPTSYHYHFRSLTLEDVEWKGKMIDFRTVLRAENRAWFQETGRNEEEETAGARHFEVHGPTYDDDGTFIVYKDLEKAYRL